MSALWIVLAFIVVQRIAELVYAQRNTQWLLAHGGFEVGAGQYPFFLLLHATWIISMAVFIAPSTVPNWWLLGIYVLLQPARVWIIASLGHYWTTRIITVPNAPLIRNGPYRFFRHPNYIVVCAEIAVVPLAFHAVEIAVVFSILNASLLSWRIRTEEQTLIARER